MEIYSKCYISPIKYLVTGMAMCLAFCLATCLVTCLATYLATCLTMCLATYVPMATWKMI